MSVVIKNKTNLSSIEIKNVTSIKYRYKKYIIDIEVPDKSEPMIMTIGGVGRYVTISGELVGDPKEIYTAVDNVFGSGKIDDKFSIDIDEWGISGDCVVEELTIRQKEGEPSKVSIEVSVIIGSFMT